jgi:trehalose synthase
VSRYDTAIFSHIEFVPPLTVPAVLVPPSIDPFAEKNREMDEVEIGAICERLGLEATSPWITQVSRFDRIKDPVGSRRSASCARGGRRIWSWPAAARAMIPRAPRCWPRCGRRPRA